MYFCRKRISLSESKHIPVYSLGEFTTVQQRSKMYQVEVFDASRHFQVKYPHRHDFYEILFLSKGSGFHIIDGNRYEIKPPCVFFMSPGQTHRLELSNDIDGYIFLFTADFYLLGQANKNKLLEFPFFFAVNQSNPPLLLINDNETQFLKNLFIKGCSEVTENTRNKDEMIRAVLDVVLQMCHKLYPAEVSLMQSNKGHILVKNLLRLIEENYQKNLSIDTYAQFLNITPNHLTQTVKLVTGNTTLKLLQNKVIIETKRLLVHTDMTVTEIADFMHFPDQSYFTKFFKKACGITPLQYRKGKR